MEDTSWHSNPGWQATLIASFIHADVAYSKANGTILSHTFVDKPWSASTPAADMLLALRYAIPVFDGSGIQILTQLITDPQKMKLFTLYAYPAWIWSWLNSAASLSETDPAMATRGAETLQSLLAVILHFCQPSVYARALHKTFGDHPDKLAVSGNSTWANSTEGRLVQFAADMLAIAPADTAVYPAFLQYQIVVGHPTLVAYMVLSVLVLAVCVFVLILGSVGKKTERYPKTSGFPVWDTYAFCSVSGEEVVTRERRQGEVKNTGGNNMIEAVSNMRVRLNTTREGRDVPGRSDAIALEDWRLESRDGNYRGY